MSGLLGSGDLYFARLLSAGVFGPLLNIGNATKFGITESAERRQRISRGRDDYGQILDEATIKQPNQLEIVVDTVDPTNLALALLGDTSVLIVEAGSVSAQSYTAYENGRIDLGFLNVLEDPAIVVTNDAEDVTYAAGTDYILYPRLGHLAVVAGGAIATAIDAAEENFVPIKASFSYGATAGTTVLGGVNPSLKGRFFLDGKNQATGEDILVDVDEANMAPTSEVDFMQENFVPLTLQGSMRLLPGKASPYTVRELA